MDRTFRRRDLIKRTVVLAAAALTAPILGSTRGASLSFEEYRGRDALGLAELVRHGDVSPEGLLEVAIARSRAVNPRINYLAENLCDRARQAVAAGLPQGPFTGVPFLLKDLDLALQGTVTTNGSRFYRCARPDYTSTVVSRYQNAGVVVFGMKPSRGRVPSGPRELS